MRIPRKAQREAKRLFRGCVVDGVLDPERTRMLVRRVVEAKPRGYLPILVRLERLVRLELQRREASVQSAVPLAAAFEAGVREKLTRLYGAGLNFVFAQNPELLGGLRVQVGSDVYDGTVRARLDRLNELF
jgi:F-type H+-transporting ATPase subunit delta